MSDLKELLERGLERFDPSAERAFDKTLGRVRRRQRDRRITAAVVAFAVFAGALTGIWAVFRGSHRAIPAGPQPFVTATVDIGESTTDVAIGPEGVWVGTGGSVVRVDPATGTVSARVHPLPGTVQRIVLADGLVWVSTFRKLYGPNERPQQPATLTAIDAASAKVVGSIQIDGLQDFAAGGGALWVIAVPSWSHESHSQIWTIDPGQLRITRRRFLTYRPPPGISVLAGVNARSLAYGMGRLWASALAQDGQLIALGQVDPHGSFQPFAQTNGDAAHLGVGAGGEWVAARTQRDRFTVTGYSDPGGSEVVSPLPTSSPSSRPIGSAVTLFADASDIAVADSGVWVTARDGRVWRIDPHTGKVMGGPLKVGRAAYAVSADESGAWVVGADKAYRIELCPASGCPQPRPSTTPSPPPVAVQDVVIRETTKVDPGCPPIGMISGTRLLNGRNGDCTLPLAIQGSGTLYGWIAPVAVDSPDRSDLVAYNTVIPTHGPIGNMYEIRVRSLDGSDDFRFEQLASSFAWAQGGRFAYFKRSPGLSHGFIGQVRVGSSPSVSRAPYPSIQWTTTDDQWIVPAWAQDRLLVYRELEGESLRLYVLDGPGQMREFGPSDTNARLVAVSPDGSQVFVALGEGGELAAVFDVATGKELARLDMSGLTDPETDSSYGLVYAGSWAGSVVAASGGPGLMLFRVTEGGAELTRVLRIADGMQEPQLESGASRVVGWQHLRVGGRDLYRWLDCSLDPERTECEAGPLSTSPLNVVYNPSRPQG